jgi:hypothetical protein
MIRLKGLVLWSRRFKQLQGIEWDRYFGNRLGVEIIEFAIDRGRVTGLVFADEVAHE